MKHNKELEDRFNILRDQLSKEVNRLQIYDMATDGKVVKLFEEIKTLSKEILNYWENS